MGANNTKDKKQKNIKESLENKNILIKNNLSKIPNPCFKRKEKFPISRCLGFEIYKLKDINNAFYFIYTPSGDKDTVIYKYYNKKQILVKISTIKFEKGYLDEIKIKYFYNPLNKKEYLFIFKEINDIVVILIKKENEFEFIYKKEFTHDEITSKYLDKRESTQGLTDIELFEIIYNKYDNIIYMIISCYFGNISRFVEKWSSNHINILTFKNDQLILIKKFIFGIESPSSNLNFFNDIPIYNDDLMNMIYEDKYSKKY